MSKIEFQKLAIENAALIKPIIVKDNRGIFMKDYQRDTFLQGKINLDIKEIFYIFSKKGVLRGLHFQNIKQQSKLIRCIKGNVYEVIVDMRKDSNTYGQWLGIWLNEINNYEILVPENCACGLLAVEDSVITCKCGEKYYSEYDSGIRWDDEKLNIDWPIDSVGGKENLIISEKDSKFISFEEWENITGI